MPPQCMGLVWNVYVLVSLRLVSVAIPHYSYHPSTNAITAVLIGH